MGAILLGRSIKNWRGRRAVEIAQPGFDLKQRKRDFKNWPNEFDGALRAVKEADTPTSKELAFKEMEAVLGRLEQPWLFRWKRWNNNIRRRVFALITFLAERFPTSTLDDKNRFLGWLYSLKFRGDQQVFGPMKEKFWNTIESLYDDPQFELNWNVLDLRGWLRHYEEKFVVQFMDEAIHSPKWSQMRFAAMFTRVGVDRLIERDRTSCQRVKRHIVSQITDAEKKKDATVLDRAKQYHDWIVTLCPA